MFKAADTIKTRLKPHQILADNNIQKSGIIRSDSNSLLPVYMLNDRLEIY